jgi:putative ATP-dependent endonuclease of OLD family
MRITNIRIRNFRLLKDVTLDLERELSLILGKNNCGKTSLLVILERFLGGSGKPSFSFDDFSSGFKDELKERVESPEMNLEPFPPFGISLRVFIDYEDNDDLSNIGNKVIMDLDPANRTVVLGFDYYISQAGIVAARAAYQKHCSEKPTNHKPLLKFLEDEHASYFHLAKKSILFDLATGKENEEVFTDLIKEQIPVDRIIAFRSIQARRNVSNKSSDRALSALSARIYSMMAASQSKPVALETFQDALTSTDTQLDVVYKEIFKEVIDDVATFGGMKESDSIIRIVSTLHQAELLSQNTTVRYGVGASGQTLPEHYNGLGYMSLISMIFEIRIILGEFKKELHEKPADINLLFIEEPEAHTHPQMQRVFIKNIKSLIGDGVRRSDGITRTLQTLLSTHSSHIVAESDFEDIKYFKRNGDGIVSRNLRDLKKEYATSEEHYKFLKQYLTIHRADMFFADKAVIIEGDTERILLPAMIKQLDQEDYIREFEENSDPRSLPLLSQNISIVEVGAYAQIFERFIDFIGTKTLVITDIDTVHAVDVLDENGKPKFNADKTPKRKIESCRVAVGHSTSNSSLQFFYPIGLQGLIGLTSDEKILKKDLKPGATTKEWLQSPSGSLRCAFQIPETAGSYHPRSFEDAFFELNRDFIVEHTYDRSGNFIGDRTFGSLVQKHMKAFSEGAIDSYDFAEWGIGKKPSFAMEILLNSRSEERPIECTAKQLKENITVEFANWKTPSYIKEGLQWLKRD